MRMPLVVGNWKMNTNVEQAVGLAKEVSDLTHAIDQVTKVICPPYVSLEPIKKALAGTKLHVGAQNLHPEPSGAFTGEVSVHMLSGLVEFAIVGHSERRNIFGESDDTVASKVIAAAAHKIRPIVCVGESTNQRDSGNAIDLVKQQLFASLNGYQDWTRLIVAYEPLWAIGTDKAASPEIAQEMMGSIRKAIVSKAGSRAGEALTLLYGGSVKSGNARSFFEQQDIDGALVGGSSLSAVEFSEIIKRAEHVD